MRSWLRRALGRFRNVFVLALVLGVAILFAARRQPDLLSDAKGERVYVVDGDTLRLGQHTLRIEDIDAVELHQFCGDADGGEWSCGLEARQALGDLVKRGGLMCETRRRDAYGRALSRCSATGSPDIAAVLVAQGWAISRPSSAGGQARYASKEAEAKAAGRGIWRGTFERPDQWRAANPREAD